jgi:integrase
MPLKDVTVRTAKARAKRYKMFDGDGLYLEVLPSGAKYWRMKYFFAGREKRLALGVYPHITLADARARRDQARKLLANGTDPAEAKKEARRLLMRKHESTFEMVAREWHQNRLDKWTAGHAKKILKRLEAHVFNRIDTRPIADITASELLSVMRKIEEHGGEIAHRMLQICGQVFAYAVITERATINPAASLRGALKPVVKSNHAYIKPNELAEYLEKLNTYDGALQTKLALRFLLLTFVRSGELRGAQWSEIDYEKAEWRIPAERMKMRETHIVPLSRQAIGILKELEPVTRQWRYLFPNQHKPSGQMSENTILYALYRMGYHSRATGHGFRSTASTVLNEHGFPPDVIERQLAHGERDKVRAAYNHAEYLPERRKMMQWWADYLDELAENARSTR